MIDIVRNIEGLLGKKGRALAYEHNIQGAYRSTRNTFFENFKSLNIPIYKYSLENCRPNFEMFRNESCRRVKLNKNLYPHVG